MTALEARKTSCDFMQKDLDKYDILTNILCRIEEISKEGGDYFKSAYYLSGYRIIKEFMENLGYKVSILRKEDSSSDIKTIVFYKISW